MIICFLVAVFLHSCVFAQGQQYVVSVPVASVWSSPQEIKGSCAYPFVPSWSVTCPKAHHDNALAYKAHDSQLLLHERVIDLGDSPNQDMLHIALPSQLDAQGNPERGYINKNNAVPCDNRVSTVTMVVQAVAAGLRSRIGGGDQKIPFGAVLQHDVPVSIGDDHVVTMLDGSKSLIKKTDVRVISPIVESEEELRQALCENAKKFLGMPYCWGGRSPFLGAQADIVSSVDCSGLVNILMHSIGLAVPRNSGPLLAFTAPVEPPAIQAGDVIHVWPGHILLCLGKDALGIDSVIEATGMFADKSNIRMTPLEQRFGIPLAQLRNGLKVASGYGANERELFFGSFFADKQKVQKMRDQFLANLGHTVSVEPTIEETARKVAAMTQAYVNAHRVKAMQRNDDLVPVNKAVPGVVLDVFYATSDNFMNKKIYSQPVCYLRRSVAAQLALVQEELNKQGLGLKVTDGYRPWSVQVELWNVCPIDGMVKNPAIGSNHNRGGAIDVTLIDLTTGKDLVMPSAIDELSEKAYRNYAKMEPEAAKNCRLLEDVMVKHGFDPLPTEWWHFAIKNCEQFPLLDVSFEVLQALG